MPLPEQGSPEWWLRRLHKRIVDRTPKVSTCRDYYEGEHPLAFASQKFRETFGGLFDTFADNWCETVVDATEERLNVTGFRVGENPQADGGAWEIWQRNDLDLASLLAHNEALVAGVSFVTVWYGDSGAMVTVEPADCAEIECDPRNRQNRLAGLRVNRQQDDRLLAELFLPDRVHVWLSKAAQKDAISGTDKIQWVPHTEWPGVDSDGSMANPLGAVPMVALENKPRLWNSRRGLSVQSELRSVIPLQNGINKTIADIFAAAEHHAMPQRYATGWTPDVDVRTNQPIKPPWTPDKPMWVAGDDTQFGQFMAGNIDQLVRVVEMLVQHVASISRTPPHYLNASADRLSGESIKAAETGLVAKVKRRFRYFGEGWEEAMRLAGRIEGIDSLAGATMCETIWADPESRTESEHIDAVGKMRQMLELPREAAWERAGATPTEIQRWGVMRATESLEQAIVPADLITDEG